MSRKDDFSIIVLDKFIQATRDSGYKGTESAIAELVDNSLQAGARQVAIEVGVAEEEDGYPLRLSVLDDGCGMDRPTLRQALRFGGSSRFNDRAGLGRFGMGLPNSSLSQARRVEVSLDRKVLYELDGGERGKRKSFRVQAEPTAINVRLPAQAA